MKRPQRKTGTKVRDGKVQRKNRLELTSHYSQVRQDETVIDRLRPGAGFRHYLTVSDVRRFIGILPDWQQLSDGLDAIVLAARGDCLGWQCDGVVAVCGWERELVSAWSSSFVDEHTPVLDRLGVDRMVDHCRSTTTWCYFTEESIKGFQLMHVLMHELGHHHDQMTTRSRRWAARSESFAGDDALRHADRLWDAYFREFPW